METPNESVQSELWKKLPPEGRDAICKNSGDFAITFHVFGFIQLDEHQLAEAIRNNPRTAAKFHKELKLSRKTLEQLTEQYPDIALFEMPEELTGIELQRCLRNLGPKTPLIMEAIKKNKRVLFVLNARKAFLPHEFAEILSDRMISEKLDEYPSEETLEGQRDIKFI